jgi:2-succinyl-6-hydroxy-2,4-cyclohexadiene-1-carboxylate synthase
MVRAVEHVVALHGFAGTGRAWDLVGDGLVAPDLPGHGSSSDLRPVSFDACVAHVLAAAPERFALAGYSLGGRVALHVALAAPQRVERLVLVATTAGIEDATERAQRRAADEALAAATERGTIDDFVARWSANPLFAGDPADAVAFWLEDMRRNEPAGLAAALRGIGTGAMAPLWDRLGELTMPATVVVGERDAKFAALGERLAAGVGGPAELVVIPGAGHGLPREAPERLAAVLRP